MGSSGPMADSSRSSSLDTGLLLCVRVLEIGESCGTKPDDCLMRQRADRPRCAGEGFSGLVDAQTGVVAGHDRPTLAGWKLGDEPTNGQCGSGVRRLHNAWPARRPSPQTSSLGRPPPKAGAGKVERGAIHPRFRSRHLSDPIPALEGPSERFLSQFLGDQPIAAEERQRPQQSRSELRTEDLGFAWRAHRTKRRIGTPGRLVDPDLTAVAKPRPLGHVWSAFSPCCGRMVLRPLEPLLEAGVLPVVRSIDSSRERGHHV